MIGKITAYVVVRPFVKEAAAKRRQLKTQQRITRNRDHAAAKRAKTITKPTFTDEELAYMRSHAVSPYRQ